MTAEDRNAYGVDVAEIRPGDRLYHRDIAVMAMDWPDLQTGTLPVAYLRSDCTPAAVPDLVVPLADISR